MTRSTIEQLVGRRVLLVAATGGHLQQLAKLAPMVGVDPSSPWLTFDTPQSRGLLQGKEVHHVPYVSPRDYRGVARAVQMVQPWLREVDGALSTGAGVALSVLPQVALGGRPSVFIESISRVQGPSVSGRILARTPKVGLYAQHPAWVSGPWRVGPSVLADYRAEGGDDRGLPRRILVTLGTIEPYHFTRLVAAVQDYQQRHPEVEVLWQLGCTPKTDLAGRVVDQLTSVEFTEAVAWADLVVAHSGVGVAMNILDAGKVPLLLDRRPELGEHVDGHQRQIKDFLTERGLAVDAEDALRDDAVLAACLATRVSSGSAHDAS